MKKTILLFSVFFNIFMINAQAIQKVEPPNWWIGMKNPKLQLMVYGENIATKSIEISDKNIILEKISKADNPNYIFLDLDLSKIKKPQKFDILFQR